jgi:hypothetical protein
MEHSPSEADSLISPLSIELEGLLSYPNEPATDPYPEPLESNSQFNTLFI